MTPSELASVLEAGAKLHQSEAMAGRDYRLTETTTEYLLTSALLRAALTRHDNVSVEVMCRHLLNALVVTPSAPVRKAVGSKRFDILIGEILIPVAAIEVKIGVRSASKLTKDVDKLASVISEQDLMRKPMLGALVFEVFVKGKSKLISEADFRQAFAITYQKVRGGLSAHIAARWPDFSVSFFLLSYGIEPADISTGTLEQEGLGAFICAAIIEAGPGRKFTPPSTAKFAR